MIKILEVVGHQDEKTDLSFIKDNTIRQYLMKI